MSVDLFLLGYRSFELPIEHGGAFFELCRTIGFSPKALQRDEKKACIRFSCTLFSAKRLFALGGDRLADLKEIRCGGIPTLTGRLLRRPGLLCGLVLAACLLVASHLFLWDIRVQGLDKITAEDFADTLASAGLSKGKFLPALNGDTIVTAIRRGDSRVAYATVNFKGTVAYVQIREAQEEGGEQALSPANLVARQDGVVLLPLIFEGECLVREGDVVRAGQILAGGILDTENHGYRVTRAAGQVLARTTHTYTVSIPFSYEKKVYTGRRSTELSLLFFDCSQKVFKSTGKTLGECDIIEKTEWWTLGGDTLLPIGLARSVWEEYTYVPATRNTGEALALARAQLDAQLAADSAGRTTLAKKVETRVDADGITLICTVICEEDIAMISEIGMQ